MFDEHLGMAKDTRALSGYSRACDSISRTCVDLSTRNLNNLEKETRKKKWVNKGEKKKKET